MRPRYFAGSRTCHRLSAQRRTLLQRRHSNGTLHPNRGGAAEAVRVRLWRTAHDAGRRHWLWHGKKGTGRRQLCPRVLGRNHGERRERAGTVLQSGRYDGGSHCLCHGNAVSGWCAGCVDHTHHHEKITVGHNAVAPVPGGGQAKAGGIAVPAYDHHRRAGTCLPPVYIGPHGGYGTHPIRRCPPKDLLRLWRDPDKVRI